ncbi:hypothetical protein ACHAXA_007261 [Cyclostephanos tholiformis]|uniref:Uncharacterized protein n=1 Tax=Cyclostephanos tholiformis TaxID=382380 RepID=A0ABD3SH57_9STRA
MLEAAAPPRPLEGGSNDDVLTAPSDTPMGKTTRARGFDPSNLSCDTCALIEESTTIRRLQEETNAAMEGGGGRWRWRWSGTKNRRRANPILRPNESIRGKYQAALLTYDDISLGQYGEMRDFIDGDVDDIRSIKGGDRLRVVKTKGPTGGGGRDVDGMMMFYGMMGGGGGFGGGGPPRLLLFGRQKRGGWTAEDEEEAVETINLRGWKREDVRDMLMTLLPSS